MQLVQTWGKGFWKKNWKNTAQSKVKFKLYIVSDAKEIINVSAINKQISYFYKSLYHEKISISKNIQTYLKTVSIIPLSKEQHDSSEGGITEKGFLKSLKSMQNGMSPGNYSYIEEFYGTLWNDTKKPFLSAVKKAN